MDEDLACFRRFFLDIGLSERARFNGGADIFNAFKNFNFVAFYVELEVYSLVPLLSF
jgi:hypothetical protein